MYICDLISNPAFNFNAPFRILWYRGGDETVTVFDSTVSGDMHFDPSRRLTQATTESWKSNTPTELWNLPPEVHIRLTSGGDRVMNPISRTAFKSRRSFL